MRTTREILRLKWACHRSNREIAQSCGTARSTVADCLRRATDAGLTWPLPPELDDATLAARLYRLPGRPVGERALPDWTEIHQELHRPHVTLQLLWHEYKASQPTGLQVQPVLRPLPPLGADARCLPPPGAPGRREALRRLRRPVALPHRPSDGGPDPRRALRRRRGSAPTCGPSSTWAGSRRP